MLDNKPLLIAIVVVGVLLAVVIFFMVSGGGEEPATVAETVEIPAPAPQPEPEPEPIVEPEPEPEPEPQPEPEPEPVVTEPEPEPEPSFVLPLLEDSDQLVRDGVVSLTRHEGINMWLGTSNLIRKAVVVADNVSNGSIPRQPLAFLMPEDPFLVQQISEDVYEIDAASYRRYNRMTDIFVSIDSRRAAEFYGLTQPLFQEAYRELGYPDGDIDEVIFKAIGRLLETPVFDTSPRLVRPVVMYEFQDERLENLSGAQKQLIRMGPRNTRLIKEKLADFARELRLVTE